MKELHKGFPVAAGEEYMQNVTQSEQTSKLILGQSHQDLQFSNSVLMLLNWWEFSCVRDGS